MVGRLATRRTFFFLRKAPTEDKRTDSVITQRSLFSFDRDEMQQKIYNVDSHSDLFEKPNRWLDWPSMARAMELNC